MLYKILLTYKDSQIQERWISEVEKLGNFSKLDIENALIDKNQSINLSDKDIVRTVWQHTEMNRNVSSSYKLYEVTKSTPVVHALNDDLSLFGVSTL